MTDLLLQVKLGSTRPKVLQQIPVDESLLSRCIFFRVFPCRIGVEEDCAMFLDSLGRYLKHDGLGDPTFFAAIVHHRMPGCERESDIVIKALLGIDFPRHLVTTVRDLKKNTGVKNKTSVQVSSNTRQT